MGAAHILLVFLLSPFNKGDFIKNKGKKGVSQIILVFLQIG
jgi:hypothetical protein